MARAKPKVDWAAVEREYRKTDTSVRELAGWYKIDEAAIRYRAKKHGWTRPGAGVPQPIPQVAPRPERVIFVREPTRVSKENSCPEAIVGRGRSLVLRMLDELDATTAHLGEIEKAIVEETENDDGRRREAMLSAVSLKARSDIVKTLALAAKTFAETGAPAGKKAEAAEAAKTAGAGSDWGDDLAMPAARPN